MSPASDVVVAGRLASGDIERLSAAGMRSVIDLSADDGTQDFDEVRGGGLDYTNLPLREGRTPAICASSRLSSSLRNWCSVSSSTTRPSNMKTLRWAKSA